MSIRLSVVIPVYNEEKVIGGTISKVATYLQSRGDNELIVVDDGSRDCTVRIVREMADTYPCVRLIESGQNGGKGGAVKRGILASRGEYVLYTDADLVYPIEDEEAFVAALEGGADVAIGNRSHPKTLFALHPRHFSYIYQRYLVGRAYIRVVKWLLELDVTDTQCGFKLFRGRAARDIFSRVSRSDFSFDVEALHVAQLLGYQIVEMPVYFLYMGEQSSVELLRDSVRMLRSLLSIRGNSRKGAYNTPHLEEPSSTTGSDTE